MVAAHRPELLHQPDQSIYRIYYEPVAGEIIKLTRDQHNEGYPYLEFTGSEIKSLKRPLSKMIVKDSQLVSRPPPPIRTMLPLEKSLSGFAVIKNNMIFVADNSITDIEYWKKNDHSN